MSRCHTVPETTFHLRNGLRHHAPECHVQAHAAAELQEIEAEQTFLRRNWQWAYANHQYGAFRVDFARRLFAGMPASDAAAHLETNAPTWPTEDFTAEIADFRAKAVGHRMCLACGQRLRDAPPCACGCQKPPRSVAGFATLGDAAVMALAKPQPAQQALQHFAQAHAPTPVEKPALVPPVRAGAVEEDYANPF